MTQFRTIEIDFDIHRLIEMERRGFDETPNSALRRLLNLNERPPKPSKSQATPVSKRSWSDDGVTLPHETLLRMSYSGRQYEGQIVDGEWIINGQSFNSPSGAASGIAVTRKGKKTKLDGWIYWYAKRPGDIAWIALATLRPKVKLEDLA